VQIVALDDPVEPEPPPPPPRLVKLTRRQWFGEGAARAAEIDFALDSDEVVVSYTTTSPDESESEPEPGRTLDLPQPPRRKRGK
jgi:hypothetical protein